MKQTNEGRLIFKKILTMVIIIIRKFYGYNLTVSSMEGFCYSITKKRTSFKEYFI